jgi:uncharacterized protein (DUF302 family)
MSAAPDALPFQNARMSKLAFVDAVVSLRKAIEAAGFWVLHEIDTKTIVQRGGHTIRATRQILFFHPDFLARVWEADQAAILEAPLKFALVEQEGGGIILRWMDPEAAFGRYGNPALAALGQELAALSHRVAAEALGA